MKKFSIVLLIVGAMSITVGILPFVFAYPYSDGPNSGPSNGWELILMLSYEGRIWFLLIGIAFSLIAVSPLFQHRKV